MGASQELRGRESKNRRFSRCPRRREETGVFGVTEGERLRRKHKKEGSLSAYHLLKVEN